MGIVAVHLPEDNGHCLISVLVVFSLALVDVHLLLVVVVLTLVGVSLLGGPSWQGHNKVW